MDKVVGIGVGQGTPVQLEISDIIIALTGSEMMIGRLQHDPVHGGGGFELKDPRVMQVGQNPQNGQMGVMFAILIGAPRALHLPTSIPWFHPTDEALVSGYLSAVSGLAIVPGGGRKRN